jgi:hypothetical protein
MLASDVNPRPFDEPAYWLERDCSVCLGENLPGRLMARSVVNTAHCQACAFVDDLDASESRSFSQTSSVWLTRSIMSDSQSRCMLVPLSKNLTCVSLPPRSWLSPTCIGMCISSTQWIRNRSAKRFSSFVLFGSFKVARNSLILSTTQAFLGSSADHFGSYLGLP